MYEHITDCTKETDLEILYRRTNGEVFWPILVFWPFFEDN